MRTYRSNKGPFKERPYFSDSDIENICMDELRAVDLYPDSPQPIRIDRFIEKRFKVVPSYDDLGDGILGLTKFGRYGVKEVIVSTALEEAGTVAAERRIRSTLAHEGGHGIFHSRLFATANMEALFADMADPSAPKILCRDEGESVTRYKGQWWEYQANRAIGALLLPKPLLEKALEGFLVVTGMLGFKTFDQTKRDEAVLFLADVFDVNQAVARIRLEQLYSVKESTQLTL